MSEMQSGEHELTAELSTRPDLIRQLVPSHAEAALKEQGIDIEGFVPIPLDQLRISLDVSVAALQRGIGLTAVMAESCINEIKSYTPLYPPVTYRTLLTPLQTRPFFHLGPCYCPSVQPVRQSSTQTRRRNSDTRGEIESMEIWRGPCDVM